MRRRDVRGELAWEEPVQARNAGVRSPHVWFDATWIHSSARARHLVQRLAADWTGWVLFVLVASATFLHLYRLNHTSISPWDESIHAIVAQHVAQHPLRPTLFETGALVPNPPPNWALTHIWLHIPPLGLWAAALSLRLLGNTPFALRLPGVLFVCAGMLVSYALGRRLFGRVVGLLGAAFVGFAPYFLMLSQGYVFGDLTDTPLLFLTPLALYCLLHGYQTGRLRWLLGTGGVTGLCYLCKAGIGVLPMLGALAALYACERAFPPETGWRRLGWRGATVVALGAVVVAGPYIVYTDIAFPAIAHHEAQNWLVALVSSYEGWGRPPDYHLTMYLYGVYGSPLALLLLGSLVGLSLIAWRRRSRADALVLVWLLALYVPLSVAVTKAAPMTIAAAPAWGYAVARVAQVGIMARSHTRRALIGGAMVGAGLLGLLLPVLSAGSGSAGAAQTYTASLPPIPLGVSLIVRFAPLILALVLSGLAAAVCWFALRVAEPSPGDGTTSRMRRTRVSGRLLSAIVVLVAVLGVGVTWLDDDWTAVTTPRVFVAPGPYVGAMIAQHTPANASIVLDADPNVSVNANFMAMFWAHRDVYLSRDASTEQLCAQAGLASEKRSPFFVLARASRRIVGMPIATVNGWTLYQPICTP